MEINNQNQSQQFQQQPQQNQQQQQQQPQQFQQQKTNKPKENLHHLKDPNTAPARIYIGNVPEAATKEDIEAKFTKYGQINGIWE